MKLFKWEIGKKKQEFVLDLAEYTSPNGEVDVTGIGHLTGMTREMALELPVVVRARNVLQAIIGSMPLVEYRPNGARASDQARWATPSGMRCTRRILISKTVEDLFFDGKAFWSVVHRSPRTGKPDEFRHWPTGYWAWERSNSTPDGGYWRCTDPATGDVTNVPARDGVFFEGMDTGLLNEGGAHAILVGLRTQRALEQAVDTPIPLGYLFPKEGQLTPDQARAALLAFEEARRLRRIGMMPTAVGFEPIQISPRDRQVYDAADRSDMSLIRATGGSAQDYGVSTTSRTYSNVQDERTTYLRHDASRYFGVIEDRLSMPDIAGKNSVRFDELSYTRGSNSVRFADYKVGLEVGVYADINEVRQAEGLPPLTAAQLKKRQSTPSTTKPSSEEPAKEEDDSEPESDAQR